VVGDDVVDGKQDLDALGLGLLEHLAGLSTQSSSLREVPTV
jgi:hypothetical protein